jgi:hypothetical protein
MTALVASVCGFLKCNEIVINIWPAAIFDSGLSEEKD